MSMTESNISKSKFSCHKDLVSSNILGGSGFFIVKWQPDSKKSSPPAESTMCTHHPFTVLLQRQLTDAKNRCIRNAKKSSGADVLPIEEVIKANSVAASQPQYRDWPTGRSHYELKQDDQLLASEQMKTLMDYVDPYCSAYFSSLPHGASNYSKSSIVLSTVQLVDSYPESEPQVWHSDSANASLTFVLPLSQQTVASGPTQIISHSHSLFALDEDIHKPPSSLSAVEKGALSSLSLQAPLLVPGDLLVMDSRLLHRGLGNRSSEVRPILVLRFDRKKRPPPGMNTFGALLRHFTGCVLHLALPLRGGGG